MKGKFWRSWNPYQEMCQLPIKEFDQFKTSNTPDQLVGYRLKSALLGQNELPKITREYSSFF